MIFQTQQRFLIQKFSMPTINSLVLRILVPLVYSVHLQGIPNQSVQVLCSSFLVKSICFLFFFVFLNVRAPSQKWLDHSLLCDWAHDSQKCISLILIFGDVSMKLQQDLGFEDLLGALLESLYYNSRISSSLCITC